MFKSNYQNYNIRIKLKIYFRKYLTHTIIFPKKNNIFKFERKISSQKKNINFRN